jgi:co-chaperonin GroES (HSP10)
MGEAKQRKLREAEVLAAGEALGVPIIRPREEVKFRAVLDKIFVEEIPVAETELSTSGLVLSDQAHTRLSRKPMTGKVLAVGDGVPMGGILMPMPYKVGDVVRCSEYGRDYINLRNGRNGENAFEKGEVRTFLIRVADTHGELVPLHGADAPDGANAKLVLG